MRSQSNFSSTIPRAFDVIRCHFGCQDRQRIKGGRRREQQQRTVCVCTSKRGRSTSRQLQGARHRRCPCALCPTKKGTQRFQNGEPNIEQIWELVPVSETPTLPFCCAVSESSAPKQDDNSRQHQGVRQGLSDLGNTFPESRTSEFQQGGTQMAT